MQKWLFLSTKLTLKLVRSFLSAYFGTKSEYMGQGSKNVDSKNIASLILFRLINTALYSHGFEIFALKT